MTAIFNPGKFRQKISIYQIAKTTDSNGIQSDIRTLLLATKAQVRTLRGFTLITHNTDFEKAYTNFNIRAPKVVLSRKNQIDWNGKTYTIEYLHEVDDKKWELEIQAKEVTA